MTKTSLLGLLLFGLFFSCAQVKKIQAPQSLPSAIPVLNITNDSTASRLTMSSLQINIVVAANIATTTFDIEFYNPNDRILEGEFEFPLADGQSITRYALEVNGALREGVVVEKAKARMAYENTVRRVIDPGLVEKTKGNNFRTRIYPIPAKGNKRVLIAVEQTLEQLNKDPLYQLPLYTQDPIKSFSVKATVVKSAFKPLTDDSTAATLKFTKWENAYIAEHKEKNYIANQTLSFSIPSTADNTASVLTEQHEGKTYFYVYDRIEAQHKKKKEPSTICLLWDVSASGATRNLAKETELLKKYLSSFDEVSVSLIPFNVFAQPKEEFSISNGNAEQLLKRLSSLDYDGGTQYGAIDLSHYKFDEVILFSDGLSTFGKKDLNIPQAPVVCITSSASADYSRLKFIALQSHGAFIDLGKLETEKALEALKGESLQVVNVSYDKTAVSDISLQTTPISNTGLSIAGKLLNNSAIISVQLGFGNDVVMTRTFTVTKSFTNDYDQVKRIWATMKIAELEMEFEKNKEEVTGLGKQFAVVTQNTSLLVLDRVEDYVQYEIVPPVELQKEYYSLLKEKKTNEKDEKETALNEALTAMQVLKDWWVKDHSRKSRKEKLTVGELDSAAITLMNVQGNAISPDAFALTDSTRNNFVYHYSTTNQGEVNITAGVGAFELQQGTFMKLEAVADKKSDDDFAKPSMTLNEWKPDVVYIKTLEKVSAKERWGKYLQLKKEYSSQPSFFIDVARFFAEKNEKRIAIQVLSNIVEMKLESSELLRMVANYLLELNETALALETFKDIMQIREEEPQSYRDLALAYNEAGEHNRAIDLLYKLVIGTWDSRFGDVKGIALNEMNAIISANKDKVNTGAIDQRLIYAMPVDVRIVVGWNTDNSDVDLWVTDPGKEKCYYQNNETYIGGRISQDVTQGYGPEEFLLKKAINGNYVVDVNLYGDSRQTLGGPITIKADMYTDFGKPQQKRKTINLRVTTNKEVVNIGALKFGS